MTYHKKHAKTYPATKIAGIILLVVASVLMVICFIAYFCIDVSETPSQIEPMTMGIETNPFISFSELEASRAAESKAATEKATAIPTRPTTVSTTTPTQKPTLAPRATEKPTEAPTEPKPTGAPEYSCLIEIMNPDITYRPNAIQLSDDERELAANIVMREFGFGGYIACCIQAQALRDAVIYRDSSVEEVYHAYQYDAYGFIYSPNKDSYNAVDYIFDGGLAVPHRILFMYCPSYAESPWHESQEFVLQYNGVRFFDVRE